jgi:hypothetical protein
VSKPFFFSNMARLSKLAVGKQHAIGGASIRVARNAAWITGQPDGHDRLDWSGKLVITDWRIYLVEGKKIAFEAMLDFA